MEKIEIQTDNFPSVSFEILGSFLFPIAKSASRTLRSSSASTPHHRPKPTVCGHVFQKNETIYRCKDCGMDDTCVMCAACFKTSPHSEHNYHISITAGSGGCCDCGDREAWKEDCVAWCDAHAPSPIDSDTSQSASQIGEEDLTPEDEELIRRTETYLECAITFLLFWSGDQYDPIGCTVASKQPSFKKLQYEYYPFANEFCMLLWNDESHSFDEVTDTLLESGEYDHTEAADIARDVDSRGFGKLISFKMGSRESFEEYERIREILNAIHLGCTFVPHSHVCTAIEIEDLFERLVAHSNLNEKFRRLVAKLLLRPFPRDVVVNNKYWNDFMREKATKLFDKFQESINHGIEISVGGEMVKPPPLTTFDLFLLMDVKLWKSLRINLKKLYISCFLKDTQLRIEAGLRFASCYLEMSRNFINCDREADLNALLFSVQLFTTPSVTYEIISRTNLLVLMLSSFEDYFGADRNPDFSVPFFKKRRYFHIFNDMKYLLQSHCAKDFLKKNLEWEMENLLIFLTGSEGVKREVRSHVEYESQTWIEAFNFMFPLSEFIQAFAKATSSPPVLDFLDSAITIIANDDNFTNSAYKFEEQKTSFFVPGVWFFAQIFMYGVEGATAGQIDEMIGKVKKAILDVHTDFSPTEDDFYMSLIRSPLATCAMISQYRAGLWVRNGYSFVNQVHNYLGMGLRPLTYDMILLFIQLTMAMMKPEDFIQTVRQNFYLKEFFLEKPSKTIDQLQLTTLLEEFFTLLLWLITEPLYNCNTDLSDESVKRHIVHMLCISPMKYSSMKKFLPEFIMNSSNFNSVLQRVAILKSSDTIDDSGKYEIREEYLKEFDPFFFRFPKLSRETAFEYLKSRKFDHIANSFQSRPALSLAKEFGRSWDFVWSLNFTLQQCVKHLQGQVQMPFSQQLLVLLLLHVNILAHDFENFDRIPVLREQLVMSLDDLLSIPGIPEFHVGIRNTLKLIDPSRSNERPRDTTELIDPDTLRKKEEARLRQERILAQFNQQQNKFTEAFQDLYDEVESEEEHVDEMNLETSSIQADKKWIPPSGGCIVCQEHKSEIRGFLGYIHYTQLFAGTSAKNIQEYFELKELGEFQPESRSNWPISVLATTCGHIMHKSCYQQYIKSQIRNPSSMSLRLNTSQKEFCCPLCKSLCNCFVDILPSQDKESIQEFKNGNENSASGKELPSEITFIQQLHDLQMPKDPGLQDCCIPKASPFRNDMTVKDTYDLAPEISEVLAYTVSAAEALSRSENLPGTTKDLIGTLANIYLRHEMENPEYFDGDMHSASHKGTFKFFLASLARADINNIQSDSEITIQKFFETELLMAASELIRPGGILYQKDCQNQSPHPLMRSNGTLEGIHKKLMLDVMDNVQLYDYIPRWKAVVSDSLLATDDVKIRRMLIGMTEPFLKSVKLLHEIHPGFYPKPIRTIIESEEFSAERMLDRFIKDQEHNPVNADLTAAIWEEQLDSQTFAFDYLNKELGISKRNEDWMRVISPQMMHFGPFKLTSLPKLYETLLNDFTGIRRDICLNSPAICLVCGKRLCASLTCCGKEGKSECYEHMLDCGYSVGMFLIVRKCLVLLIHNERACFMNAPYRDQHGEPDFGLRNGRPLFLSEKRVKELERIWIADEIPSLIIRRSENISQAQETALEWLMI